MTTIFTSSIYFYLIHTSMLPYVVNERDKVMKLTERGLKLSVRLPLAGAGDVISGFEDKQALQLASRLKLQRQMKTLEDAIVILRKTLNNGEQKSFALRSNAKVDLNKIFANGIRAFLGKLLIATKQMTLHPVFKELSRLLNEKQGKTQFTDMILKKGLPKLFVPWTNHVGGSGCVCVCVCARVCPCDA